MKKKTNTKEYQLFFADDIKKNKQKKQEKNIVYHDRRKFVYGDKE